MKINFLRENIIYFFDIINFLPKKQNGEVYFSVQKSKIYFYNKNIKIEYKILKTNNIENDIIVNLKYDSLAKIIKTINTKYISLTLNKKNIFFKKKGLKLLLLSKKIKKIINIKKSHNLLLLDNKEIINVLKTVIIVYKINNPSNGIYFNIKKKNIDVISCDNFRFLYNKIKLLNNKYKKEFYIKDIYIKLLIKILDKKKNTKLYINKKSITFCLNKNIKFEIIFYKDKNFNFKPILNIKTNILVQIDKNILFIALKRAKLLCNNKNKIVCLKIKKKYVKISSNNLEKEIFVEKVKNSLIPYRNKKLYFNVDYLLDFISLVKNNVIMYYNKKKKIVLFKASENKNCKYILMPIETNY
ncbi:hypothetical protein ACT2CC_00635 [Candidatus Vidania fulgoroideorum]